MLQNKQRRTETGTRVQVYSAYVLLYTICLCYIQNRYIYTFNIIYNANCTIHFTLIIYGEPLSRRLWLAS